MVLIFYSYFDTNFVDFGSRRNKFNFQFQIKQYMDCDEKKERNKQTKLEKKQHSRYSYIDGMNDGYQFFKQKKTWLLLLFSPPPASSSRTVVVSPQCFSSIFDPFSWKVFC